MALLQTLQDSFGGSSLNTGLWTDTSYSGGTAVVSGGTLTCSPLANTGNTSGNITSATTYDLTASYGLVKVTQVVSQNGATYFYVQKDGSNKLYFRVLSGNIIASKVVAGVDTQLTTAAYSSTTHLWWKIREAGGTCFFDTSTNGVTWNNFTSLANPFVITSVSAVLEGYDFSSDSAPGGAKFLNFNFPTTRLRSLLGVGL